MTTIKEVAKMAGVSIGTVSNVLNGKTNNIELIDRVEHAMKELGYRPDANARSLKSEKSGLIGFVLPNSTNPENASLLSHIQSKLSEKGYSILLFFSQNNKLLEKKAIEKCLEKRVDGIILFSSLKRKKEVITEKEGTPIVMVSYSEASTITGDAIILDYSRAFEQILDYYERKGRTNVALIIDESFYQNEEVIEIYNKRYGVKGLLKISDYSKERGFKAAYELFFLHPEIDAVISGNYLIAEGVEKAIKLLKIEDIEVAVLKEGNWIEDEAAFPVQISFSQKKIAERVIEKTLDAIENPKTHEAVVERIHAEYKETRTVLHGVERNCSTANLKFALYESPTSISLTMLAEVYAQQTGTNIEFDLYKYDELEHCVHSISDSSSSLYDGVMMDITWIDELVRHNVLAPLDQSNIDFQGFIPGLEQQCGVVDGKYHAVPIMSGTQLLFYQKDLFENESLKRQFARTYGNELTVPQTWSQFNIIAEFFTRAYNSKSPTTYGITSVSGENIYTTISYLNRLWSYGSDVFDDNGKVLINNRTSLTALMNFVNSSKYSSPQQLYSWDEAVEDFKKGHSAMTILYDSYANELNDYTKSKVAGNLGVGYIPGGTPVLGGWSLGINKNSTNIEEVIKFLTWVSSDHAVIPLALLGGSTLRKSYYESNDLEDSYPWKNKVLDSYRKSRKRILPNVKINNKGRNYIYSHVISKEINASVRGQISEEQALINIEQTINRLMEENK
ncbi:hypothetical protein J27TS8_45380 [Robertmurraya siralis]|uniref:HTH lacI-type domain-containing protein n=1 Tax=Robertmurraya siralis TaxID=77777 RepID=A0A919WLZ5_9BACI|nr:extracellular solute-binding protein [Robertmurraya siralis]PAE20954.1 hypothetical protein CHH80_08875 [Bacillus sp. 7504-2]GIN64545.1 hypothetical protein J27TS8_45380 [Robertmurraya siralis]